ncbi:MAG: GerMN domain-containing protein [Clostridiales bacterium]|nr:GerMN domain-containing protein [Clostridiales bacterium]
MKGNKLLVAFLSISLCVLMGGCSLSTNPLEKVRATSVPGLAMRLHPASASDENVDTFQVSLYFRFENEPMLAAETRMLTARRDESKELVLLRALLEGPSAGHSELKRLFPEGVQVESVTEHNGILYITFNDALLTADEVPDDWQSRPEWVIEAPTLRALTIQSAIASVTESFPYHGVQILVYSTHKVQSSLRLENSYFLTDAQGLSEPLSRNESLLLTPQNAVLRLMKAWQLRDYAAIYPYIATGKESELKPSLQNMSLELDAAASLMDYTVSGGSVSTDGRRCVLTVQYTLQGEGSIPIAASYPLPLIRENDIWKIEFAQLLALMVPTNH